MPAFSGGTSFLSPLEKGKFSISRSLKRPGTVRAISTGDPPSETMPGSGGRFLLNR